MVNTENRILVTGGTGFIGTHLVNELVRLGVGSRVEVVDNLTSSTMTPSRFRFFQKHDIIFRQQSVEDFEPDKGVRYGEIYHLACPVGPVHVLKYAGRMARIIAHDAEKMANLALRDGAKMFSVSTSEVYGRDPNGKPQSEEDVLEVSAATTVRQEYAVAKLLTEISLRNMARVEPLRIVLIRPFNIVGPHQSGEGGFVIPRFVEAALADEPLSVFGDGMQKRAFTHVCDLVKATRLLMESDAVHHVYNVGTPENLHAIAYVAKRVVKVLRSSSQIHFVDPQDLFGSLYAEAYTKIPDVTRIVEEFGWRSTQSLDDIIRDYAAFARSQGGARALHEATA